MVQMLLCFDIGGSRIKAAMSASPGELQLLGDAPTPLHDFGAFCATMAGFLTPGLRGVAISITGCVDPSDGRLKSANIPCLDGRQIAQDLDAALGLPVWILNDADSFALAEATSGVAAGHRNVFGVILGSGVGGGLVIDGRIVAGVGGFAGEWGHGPVVNARPLGIDLPRFACGCGQVGCVNTIGGARGMERLHSALHGQQLSSQSLLEHWQAGDPAAARTVDVWLDLVADVLATVLNVVGSSVVPVGGGLSNVKPLIAALDQAVRARVLRRDTGPILRCAKHQVEPGLIGAAQAGWQGLAHG
jgi:N-acetylglucosamine kinase